MGSSFFSGKEETGFAKASPSSKDWCICFVVFIYTATAASLALQALLQLVVVLGTQQL